MRDRRLRRRQPEPRAPRGACSASCAAPSSSRAPSSSASPRNANRGLRKAPGDVVLLNSDVVAHRGWLERLQQAAYARDDIGMAAPKLLYPDGRIQSAGSHRNLGAPEWFDHRYRFQAGDLRARQRPRPGARGHRRRAVRQALDHRRASACSTRTTTMAFEDVDWCLRALGGGPADRLPALSRAHPPGVGHARHGAGRARAGLPGPLLGALGRLLRPPRRAHRRRRAAHRLRDRGHRRRRRPPRHLRAPQPPASSAATRPSCGRAARGRRTGSTCDAPVRSFDAYDELAEALEPLDGDQGRDVVGDRRRPCGRPRCATASRPTSSRTSRPRTTPTAPTSQRRACVDTYRARVPLPDDLGAGTASAWPSTACPPELVPPGRRPGRRSASATTSPAATGRAAGPRPRQPAEEPRR